MPVVESAHGVEGGALGQRTWHTVMSSPDKPLQYSIYNMIYMKASSPIGGNPHFYQWQTGRLLHADADPT
jgi:hypothetical protein